MKTKWLSAPDFNLAQTLDSGQVFHWENCGNGYLGTIDANAAYVEQSGNRLGYAGVTADVIQNYFALDHPLAEIQRSFPIDPALRTAADFCQGLRIIRQPYWECLATFITSSMKQVAHIRQISKALRQRFGKRIRIWDLKTHSYPSAARLAELTEAELRDCALGYRAKHLLGTARLIAAGEVDLKEWAKLDDEALRAHLCGLPGVGAKIANCVMLFGYERLRAFPIDVWIERVLKEHYFAGKRRVTARQLRAFCDSYFGEHGGYAQQYLFHHARKNGPSRKRVKSPRNGASS
jgi:N-glycosylase/DNA lyase